MHSLFRTKSIDALIASAEEPHNQLRRTLGPWSLTALGVGAVIGSGIFILTGTAAAGKVDVYQSLYHVPVLDILVNGVDKVARVGRPGAGPGVALSFIIVALVCSLAALCYAELASMIPVAGSAYTYTYATLGELFAWVIGWDLVLEYAVSNMAVAASFSAYFNSLLESTLGFRLPPALSEPAIVDGRFTGAIFNVPALLILLVLTVLLVRGVKESANANTVMVIVKVAAILVFVFGAAGAVQPTNYTPAFPNGAQGVLTGAAIVFFTYIGFDSISTAAEECKQPQRDLPAGILMTLVACTVLYVAVAVVLTGIQNWQELNNAAPVANALKALGRDGLLRWVSVGALLGMISSLLVFQYGQARIWYVMSRDGLLPKAFSRVHPRFQTPHVSTWVAGLLVGIPAGIWDIGTFADLSSLGTMFAFMLVSVAVIILRRTQPERPRGFRVPWVPLLPILSVVCCLVLMLSLTVLTWIAFFVWLAVGLVVYLGFGRRASVLAQQS